MACALLAGQLPPAATPESEQYAIAVLAYLLLTGLHPIEAPAVQDEMLRRIAERPPLPFAARGIPAWPQVEAVVERGLARQPDQRFPDISGLARAFASADTPPDRPMRWPSAAQHAFDAAVETVRRLLAPSVEFPLDYAWFGMRAALAMEDAELLAAADVLAGWAGTGWAAQSVVLLPVQGLMITKLGYHHLRQQTRSRRALFNGLCWLLRRLHGTVAGVAQPDVLDHLHGRGNVLVAFALVFPDQPQILAAISAAFL
jgi:hypothetical protein